MGKRVGLLAWLMVLALSVGTVAQEPSPPPWIGGRVEMPEHGFAVTLPDDWAGFDPGGHIDGQLMAAQALDGRLNASAAAVVREDLAGAEQRGQALMAWDLAHGGVCALSAGSATDYSTDDVAEAIYSHGLVRGAAIEEPQTIVLPAGAGWTIASSEANAEDPTDARWVVAHIIEGRGDRLLMECAAADPPEDRWRSILETVEFLPEEE